MSETVTVVKTGKSEVVKSFDSLRNNYRYSWNYLFKKIKDGLTDPKNRNETFIFGSYPEWHINDESYSTGEIKDKYPLVIINNPMISDFENHTMDYKTSDNSIDIAVEIFSDRNDYLDTLSDNILYILLNDIQSATNVGLHNMTILNDSYTPYFRNGVKIHSRSYTIRYDITRSC